MDPARPHNDPNALSRDINRFPENPLVPRQVVLTIQPVWPDSARPPVFHSCTTMSRRGETKIVPKIRPGLVQGAEFTEEVCPCGGVRVLCDGEPYGKWCHRNAARWYRDWPTRAQNMKVGEAGQFVKYI